MRFRHRMTNDERTRSYRDAHLAKGWTKKAVYRALKRAVAREVVAALAGHCKVPQHRDLRPARRAKNITLTTVATALGVWPARVGELELGRRRDDAFADRYRAWLNVA
jgi:transposase